MWTQRILVSLIVVNLVLLALVVSPLRQAFARPSVEPVAPVLRAHSLEIVDEQGRMRAQIVIAPPSEKDGVKYPDTVLFRLMDPEGQPSVKIAASVEGSGMNLLGGPDSNGWHGLQILADAKSSLIRILNPDGREVLIQP